LILGVAPNGNRAGHVTVNQAERAAEQVDARGDHRRPNLVVLEHQRLDQVVDVAAMVRDIDDAASRRRQPDDAFVLGNARDLAEDRVERMLQRAVDRVSLARAQLLEVFVDALLGARP